jgi:hypothetical protein
VLGAGGHVVFTLFLRRVAGFFGNTRLARSAGRYLIFYGALPGAVVLVAVGGTVLPALARTRTVYRQEVPAGPGGPGEGCPFEAAPAERPYQPSRGPGVLGWVVILVLGVGFLAALVVQVLWFLDLVRRTRGTIARARETGPWPAPVPGTA